MKENNAVFDKEGKKIDRKTLLKMLEEQEDQEKGKDINPALAEDELRNKPIKINIACGQNKEEGFIGIDKVKTKVTDIVHNLETFPWPLEDNYADEVVCSHYVEHTKDLIKFMDEIYRITKVGAKVTIIAPYYSSIRAWQDPTHLRAISEWSFAYFNKNWRVLNNLDHYDIKSDFDFTFGYQVDPAWATRAEEARVFAMKHYINVVTDIHVTLTKRGN